MDLKFLSGIDRPRVKGVEGNDLVKPRVISNKLAETPTSGVHRFSTQLFMQWAQMISHDINKTPTSDCILAIKFSSYKNTYRNAIF